MRTLATCEDWRSSDTSLMARAVETRPPRSVAVITSGWTMERSAASSRACRPSSTYSFMRKPTEPRFMP